MPFSIQQRTVRASATRRGRNQMLTACSRDLLTQAGTDRDGCPLGITQVPSKRVDFEAAEHGLERRSNDS
jgi:hypothetical protein